MLKDSFMTQSEPRALLGQWQKLAIMVGSIVLIFLLAWLFISWNTGGLENKSEALSAVAFEEKTGLRVSLIAVTAAGGLVDVRFKVLDVEKVTSLFQDSANVPILIVEDSGVTTLPPDFKGIEDVEFIVNRAYPLLYVNPEGAIQTGTSLTVVIGEYRIEHIIAK